MSTPAIRLRRWTRQDYELMVESGGFGANDRIELLDGEIWDVSPHGSRHASATRLVYVALDRVFGTGIEVRPQLPFALDKISELEPDIAVVPGRIRDYVDEHPSQALLVVEVSESSLAHDRGRKLAAYARNGVPEYWVLDLNAAKLEVHRDPADDGYSSKTVLGAGDAVTPLHAPTARIPVADLLP